jgi:hypothetical protein
MEDTKKILEVLGSLNEKVTGLQGNIGELKEDVKELKEVTEEQGKEIKSVKFMLENEVRESIQLIAEGHLTLERKLDESLKVNQERELLLIRVAKLETEVRELKERMNG